MERDRLRDIRRYKEAVAEATFHNDGYVNMLNKVGMMQDNSTAWQYVSEGLESDLELTRLYASNGLFTKIIDRPAEDALSKGIDLSDLGDDLEKKVMKKLTKLKWVERAIEAEKWSRLFGGALCVMLVNDGRGLDEPLNWKRADGLEEIRVFERAIVEPDYTTMYNYYSPEMDWDKPFGVPLYYNVYSVYGQFRVHYSRCLVFRNGNTPEYTLNDNYRYWGIPVYTKIKEALRETVTSHHDGTKLLERSVLGVYKMQNLSNLLATDEGEDKVIKRLQVIDMARNIINSMAIDASGEDYQYINASMAGASDIIDRTCNMLSAVTDIPQTILFGKSPSGMDATGDNDMENYYQMLSRIQTNNLKDNTETVVKLVLLEMVRKGELEKELPEYEVKFVPFKQLTEAEQAGLDQTKAATEQTKAATAQLYVQMQALDPSEVRKALSDSDAYQIQGLVDEDNLELPQESMEMGQGQGGMPGMGGGMPGQPGGGMNEKMAPGAMPGQDADDHYDDSEGEGWVTISGQHVHFNEKGEMDKGNPRVFGRNKEEGPKAPAKRKPTSLERMKELSSQFTEALKEGQRRGAMVVEFKFPGGSKKMYWNGASYGDKPSSMAEQYSKNKGTYSAEFKTPDDWDTEEEEQEEKPKSSKSKESRYYPYKASNEKVKDLEDALEKTRSASGVNKIAGSARKLIQNIDKELENPEDPDGVHRLKAIKYRANQLLKKCEAKYNGDDLESGGIAFSDRHDMMEADAEEPVDWITVNGKHIPLDENGDVCGGDPRVFGEENAEDIKAAVEARKQTLSKYKSGDNLRSFTVKNGLVKANYQGKDYRVEFFCEDNIISCDGPEQSASFIDDYMSDHKDVLRESEHYQDVLDNVSHFVEKHPELEGQVGTYDAVTGESVNHEGGFSVTFHQNYKVDDPYGAYDADTYAKMCAIAKNELNASSVDIGYFGNPEVSFNCNDKQTAVRFAIRHNQHSVYDCVVGAGEDADDWSLLVNPFYNEDTNPIDIEE